MWQPVETPGRSSFHIRLFPLYIKPSQAHCTRFNKVQKPKPKPGWALKEVRKEHCHDWHGHNMQRWSQYEVPPRGLPRRTASPPRSTANPNGKSASQGAWASPSSYRSLPELIEQKVCPQHSAPRKVPRPTPLSYKTLESQLQVQAAQNREKPTGSSATKPGWNPSFDVN